jgi:hypothetical protein
VLKTLITALLLTAATALVACSPGDAETRTETISPAVPPPSEPSDDAGLTQTTEIGEERSPHEGDVLAGEGTEGEPPATTTTGSAPPPKKRD